MGTNVRTRSHGEDHVRTQSNGGGPHEDRACQGGGPYEDTGHAMAPVQETSGG